MTSSVLLPGPYGVGSAKRLGSLTGIPVADVKVHDSPGGKTKLRIDEEDTSRVAFTMHTGLPSQDLPMQQRQQPVEIAGHGSARAYGLQDRRFREDDAVSGEIVLRTFHALSAAHVVAVEIHNVELLERSPLIIHTDLSLNELWVERLAELLLRRTLIGCRSRRGWASMEPPHHQLSRMTACRYGETEGRFDTDLVRRSNTVARLCDRNHTRRYRLGRLNVGASLRSGSRCGRSSVDGRRSAGMKRLFAMRGIGLRSIPSKWSQFSIISPLAREILRLEKEE